MDTIKRLGENETVRRITNGTLKSYVDREIDAVDTSAFINLETLNVPKAESVTIGEGVKDTLEVLNAPKAEDFTVDNGGLTVNWGKCGTLSNDLVVTYKPNEPLWIPQEFLLEGHANFNAHFTEPSTCPEVGYCTWFCLNDYGSRTTRSTSLINIDYIWINVYKLPQELGKYLYDNAETGVGYGLAQNIYSWYKGIAMYWDNPTSFTNSEEYGIGIRRKSDLLCISFDSSGNGTEIDPSTSRDYSCCYNYPEYKKLDDDGYYLVAQVGRGYNGDGGVHGPMLASSHSDTDHLYLRHWKTMTSKPTSDNMGAKYLCPLELCINNNLSNLPSLKVADVHSADIDVPMFKGCTNLEKATVGGTKGIEPLVVNWGKCGGSEDVIVEYKGGEPLWIPKAFLNEPFKDGASPSDVINNVEVGYVKAEQNNKNLLIYRLPQELGKWLYENAEDCKTYDLYDGDATHVNSRIYKGIAIYPDNTNSWVGSDNWGVGIRTTSDLSVKGWASGTTTSTTSTPMSTEGMVEGAYYLVAQQNFTINASTHRWDGSGTTFLRLQLEEWSGVEADDSGVDHIYLRRFNTMTKKPHWSNTSSWTQETDDPTNVGEKYACPMEFCIPTLNPSYFEGCNNLREVVITNPELRFNNAIPSTVELYADDSKLPSDGLLEYSKNGLPPVMVTMATYLQANNSGYRVKGAEKVNFIFPQLGGKIFYIDSEDNGATYHFYDEDKNEITGWSTISDLADAKYYSVEGAPSKDKFYVYYPTKYDDLQWGYNDTSVGATGTAVGTGKTNTATVMSRTDIPTGTIWSKLSEVRTSSGINDLFIPSKDEVDKFREADLEVWHRKTGGSYLWSSSESSASNAWRWVFSLQDWYNSYKSNSHPLFFVRAF